MESMGVRDMNKLFNNIFNNKNILVTGHTGFKGSWLSIWLTELGANVIGYALDPYTKSDNFVVTRLSNNLVDNRADIRDYSKLFKTITEYNIDIVFHLAAQPLVSSSYEKPIETYEINLMGTLNLLECIRKSNSIKVAIIITSDKCYKNKEQIWGYRENDPMGGFDPYSSSKGCTELLTTSYRNSFFHPDDFKKHGKSIATVRAGNVIGGGDWSKNRIVPDCIKALIKQECINVRNPEAVRPFQHVLEPLNGYLMLAKKMYDDGAKYCGAWNFGPELESVITVKTLVNTIIDKWGSGYWDSLSIANNFHEAKLLNLDCTRAKKYLGWKPKLTIEQAIEYTISWYKFYKQVDVMELCRKQIQEFSNIK